MPVEPKSYICVPCNETFATPIEYLFHLRDPTCTAPTPTPTPTPSGPVEFKQGLHQHGSSGAVFTYNGHEVVGPTAGCWRDTQPCVAPLSNSQYLAATQSEQVEEQNQPEEQDEQDEQTQLQVNQP